MANLYDEAQRRLGGTGNGGNALRQMQQDGEAAASSSPVAQRLNSFGDAAAVANDRSVTQVRGAQQQFAQWPSSALAPPQGGAGQSALEMLSRIPGVYENGRGQFSDRPSGAGFGEAPASQGAMTRATNLLMGTSPEYQPNMQSNAARALGQISPVGMTVTLAQPASVQAPEVLHSGNSWSRRNELRNAEVSAKALRGEWDMYRDGMIDRNGRPIKGASGVSSGRAKYDALLAQDMAAQGLEPTLAAKAMSENAGLQREGLQQGGANLRTGMEQQGQAQRFLTTTLMQAGRDRRADQHQTTQDSIARQRLGLDTFRAIRGNLPAGYRQSPDGTGLEFIPGGPADPSTIKGPLNDTQSKALQFGTRMQASGQNMDRLAAGGVDQPGLIKRGADALGLGTLANWTQSPQQQQVEQSQRDFVNAVLRRESGAAISESEFDSARRQYFPQIGDSPQVAEQKRQNRELATRGMLAEVPDGDRRVQQVRGTPAQNGGQPSALDELRRRAQSNPELADRLRAAGY